MNANTNDFRENKRNHLRDSTKRNRLQLNVIILPDPWGINLKGFKNK